MQRVKTDSPHSLPSFNVEHRHQVGSPFRQPETVGQMLREGYTTLIVVADARNASDHAPLPVGRSPTLPYCPPGLAMTAGRPAAGAAGGAAAARRAGAAGPASA